MDDLTKERLKLEFLPRLLKLWIKHDVVIVVPACDIAPSRQYTIKKGTIATLMDMEPVTVATADGAMHIGSIVRIDKLLPQEEDPTVLQRILIVPNEALEVHPDYL